MKLSNSTNNKILIQTLKKINKQIYIIPNLINLKPNWMDDILLKIKIIIKNTKDNAT